MRSRGLLAVAVAVTGVVVGGIGVGAATTPTEPASTAAESEPAEGDVSIVVIGDSIPFNASQDCSGCTSFADSYGDAIAAGTGETVVVENRSRHDGARTADVEQELASGALADVLDGADVVIISVGYNDQPPYDGERPCAAASLTTDAELFAAVIATTRECVDEVTGNVRESVASILSLVRSIAPDAAIGVLTSYDSWAGWPALEAAGPETAEAVGGVIAYGLEQWRAALCAEAEVAGAVCVDLYEGFNGPAGDQVAGALLAPDYTHPSQLGNDLIRDLLLASELYTVDGDGAASSTTADTEG